MMQMWQYQENDEAYDDYDETNVNDNKQGKIIYNIMNISGSYVKYSCEQELMLLLVMNTLQLP